MCGNKGCILILNVTIDAKNFVLINFYNPYTENQEVEVLNTLVTMMKTIDMKKNSNFLLAGDFNVLIQIQISYNVLQWDISYNVSIPLSKKNPLQNWLKK